MKFIQTLAEFRASGGLRTILDDHPDDLFITCVSFEARCLAVSESMLGNYRAKKGIAYINQEFSNVGLASEHTQVITTTLSRSCEVFDGITVGTWEDAAQQFKVLRSALAPHGIQNN